MSNGLGDVVMAIPALKSYLEACHKKKIFIIVSTAMQVKALALYLPGNYKAYSLDGGVFKTLKLYVRMVFVQGPIAAPALSSKHLSLMMLCLFGKKIYTNSGAAFSIPKFIIRLKMSMYDKGVHQVNYYIDFLSTVTNIPIPKLSFMPLFFDNDKSIVNAIPVIALGISSGITERHKIPSPAYFASFVNHLSSMRNCRFLLVSTTNDNDVVEEFLSKVQKDICMSELKDLSLLELVHIVKHADLAISGTTGQGHIFSTCNVPMLVFSGVTDFHQSGPFAKQVTSMIHKYPCGPCYHEKFRFGCGRKCMEDIDINEAVDEALKILDKSFI
jgi:ADP-heptose:LPS heptosyltransferase